MRFRRAGPRLGEARRLAALPRPAARRPRGGSLAGHVRSHGQSHHRARAAGARPRSGADPRRGAAPRPAHLRAARAERRRRPALVRRPMRRSARGRARQRRAQGGACRGRPPRDFCARDARPRRFGAAARGAGAICEMRRRTCDRAAGHPRRRGVGVVGATRRAARRLARRAAGAPGALVRRQKFRRRPNLARAPPPEANRRGHRRRAPTRPGPRRGGRQAVDRGVSGFFELEGSFGALGGERRQPRLRCH
mmetsp:Transcript_32802/g.110547  ORF Transcript_32802/g.110547 Transcript_32802/m.110547 type:complete len:251 (+) Transcript_32802:672-1424(+)